MFFLTTFKTVVFKTSLCLVKGHTLCATFILCCPFIYLTFLTNVNQKVLKFPKYVLLFITSFLRERGSHNK